MRIAIYARVSTKTGAQDTANQLLQLREFAARHPGWQIVREYVDNESGKSADREQLQAMFAAAHRREFDVLLVWALDRLSRQGVLETFQHIERLRSYAVSFESLQEPQFSGSGPAGELMLAVAAWIAKQERVRISERVQAGLQRAVAGGKKLGRPQRIFDRRRAQEMCAAGASLVAIGVELGVPKTTVADALKATSKSADLERRYPNSDQ